MTILPIVEREMRVAARVRSTYWSRSVVALLAMLAGGFVMLVNYGAPPAKVGSFVFIALAVFAMLHCLLSGRFSTVDCLSQEKREGTLGLLFLTDLKGYDVVLGKLVATSLKSFYGLLALLPVLAIPLLLGGVTNGQFWRMVLVLVNTFLFSLAIGMFSSAISRDHRQSTGANFSLMVFFSLLLPGIAGLIKYSSAGFAGPLIHELFFASPLYGFVIGLIFQVDPAMATMYPEAAAGFWKSLVVIHGLTWFFLYWAARVAPRSWQDRPVPAVRTTRVRARELWHAWSYGHPAKRPAFRKRLLDQNAYYWLAARARLKPWHVWTFFGLLGAWWFFGYFNSGRVWFDDSVNVTLALMLNTTLKLWIAIEAGQRLAEDKKIGALELVLSTPLTERDIVRGQLLALRRQFLVPVLVAIAVELWLMQLTVRNGGTSPEVIYTFWLAGIIMLPVDLAALAWVAMGRALTAKNLNRSIIETLASILVLPWVCLGLARAVSALWQMWMGRDWFPGWKFDLGFWFGTGLAADLVFGLAARGRLLRRLREFGGMAQSQTSVENAGSNLPKASDTPSPGRNAPSSGARRQAIVTKRTLSAAMLVLILGAGYFWSRAERKYAPAIVVPGSLSQGPLRVFAGVAGALFILPDGSLWHWGRSGGTPAVKVSVPERLGTNSDWKQVEPTYKGFVGIRRDGTLWRQEQGYDVSCAGLEQIGSTHDWEEVTATGQCAFAIKQNGTLWAWGDNSRGQLGNGPGPNQTNLIQVGSDANWADVECTWSGTLGLRKDGTLWTWGQNYHPVNKSAPPGNLAAPTRISSDTNWTGFTMGFFLMAENSRGELWLPFRAPPSAESPAAATCDLVVTNVAPDHVAIAFIGKPSIYQIHGDGTLWQRLYPFSLWAAEAAGEWHQVGKRSDWRSLQGARGTVYGVTADGTLWTWGVDPNREPQVTFSTRMAMLQARLKGLFGGSSPGTVSQGGTPQYDEQPHALMKLKGHKEIFLH